jgi:hypothetical protein
VAGLAGWNLDLTADLAGPNVLSLIDSTTNKRQALQVRISKKRKWNLEITEGNPYIHLASAITCSNIMGSSFNAESSYWEQPETLTSKMIIMN